MTLSTVLAAAAITAPMTASAGVGITMELPASSAFESLWLGYYSYYYGPSAAAGLFPSFDVRLDDIVIQIHGIETIIGLSNNDVYVGGDVFAAVLQKPVVGDWHAFLGAGGTLDALLVSEFQETTVAFGPVMPVGVWIGEHGRVALYGTLGLVISNGAGGELGLGSETALRVSVWL